MNTTVAELMKEFRNIASKRFGLGAARVACKVNAKGELVIAVIVTERYKDGWRKEEREGKLPPPLPAID